MSKQAIRIKIVGGKAIAVYDDALVGLMQQGRATTTRASHVEPWAQGCSSLGRAAGWQADMAPVRGPVLGPFRTRQAALDAERAYLLEHFGV